MRSGRNGVMMRGDTWPVITVEYFLTLKELRTQRNILAEYWYREKVKELRTQHK
jgi:hypothetical protein